jgi:arginyl-tRNA synthetase
MQMDISDSIAACVAAEFSVAIDVVLSRPEPQFGDISTNVALQLASSLESSPREIAERLLPRLTTDLGGRVKSITVAGPGFINITFSDAYLLAQLDISPTQSYAGKTVVAEYSDPNPFKQLHAGHLYTTITGNAIAKLFAVAGAHVHRINFGGDVGLHVAKAIWGLIHDASPEDLDEAVAYNAIKKLGTLTIDDRATIITQRYVEGSRAYEEDEMAKSVIIDYNRRIYALFEAGEHDSPFAKLYFMCRTWSYQYFDSFYADLAIDPFEAYFPESETAPIGLATVREQQKNGVYSESDGAVVFVGEPYGLHTRVFITSQGLPTYETKDLGNIIKKWRDYHYDLSVVITGNDITEYMKVVLQSVQQFEPELATRTKHVTHGQIKLEGGVKMSSRKGNGLSALDVLSAAQTAATQANAHATKQTAYAAVKYAFLKQRIGGDIIYLPNESVSLEGNSGPYLQYAHARACSILRKADPAVSSLDLSSQTLDEHERSLVRMIGQYAKTVDLALAELLPHHICTYLYELAQTFNRFYEQSRVIGDKRQAIRLELVKRYAVTLANGLELLGMSAPDAM